MLIQTFYFRVLVLNILSSKLSFKKIFWMVCSFVVSAPFLHSRQMNKTFGISHSSLKLWKSGRQHIFWFLLPSFLSFVRLFHSFDSMFVCFSFVSSFVRLFDSLYVCSFVRLSVCCQARNNSWFIFVSCRCETNFCDFLRDSIYSETSNFGFDRIFFFFFLSKNGFGVT